MRGGGGGGQRELFQSVFRAAILGPKIKSWIWPAHFLTILISHNVLQSHFPPRQSRLVISVVASDGPL